jgi:hypothetical protein
VKCHMGKSKKSDKTTKQIASSIRHLNSLEKEELRVSLYGFLACAKVLRIDLSPWKKEFDALKKKLV